MLVGNLGLRKEYRRTENTVPCAEDCIPARFPHGNQLVGGDSSRRWGDIGVRDYNEGSASYLTEAQR